MNDGDFQFVIPLELWHDPHVMAERLIHFGYEYQATHGGLKARALGPNSSSAVEWTILQSGGQVPDVVFIAPGLDYYRNGGN